VASLSRPAGDAQVNELAGDYVLSQTLISFVRHGHVHNPQGVYYGRLPRFRLSDEGLCQAQAVSKSLSDKELSAIFSSPLLRARQTAKVILAAHPNLVLRQSKLLLEVYSPFDGRPVSELIERCWDVYSGAPAGYEQPLDVLNRAKKFVTMIRRQYAGQHVIAVTHGDLIAFLILWARAAPVDQSNKEDLRRWGVQNKYPAPGSITTLEFKTVTSNEMPRIEYHSTA
jgi:broad specificity phosphatase PhoE